ncbi:MAG: dihydrolipoyl dehydrogenase [Actinomycetota bacterium]|nr:dihydrolipoyl dehydrogenase [Actinomycetota bacterium]
MQEEKRSCDVVVIGGGPAGHPAAMRAAQIGKKVVLVEKNRLGGTCLNRGCIPTKTLIASSERLAQAREAEKLGVKVAKAEPDWKAIIERKNRVIETLTRGIEAGLRSSSVELVKGNASITQEGEVLVKETEKDLILKAEKIIIATGSEPREIPVFDFSKPSVLTSTDALNLEKIPESLVVVGSGVMGSEFAAIFSSLGTNVVMVEMMDKMLPTEDSRVSRQMKSLFSRSGIEVMTSTSVQEVFEYQEGGIKLKLSTGEVLEAEKVLVSIGRKLNSSALGLEKLGIEVEKDGAIKVNERMETSESGIFAAGDVTGGIMLAHVATFEGIVAAENACGREAKMDYRVVPSCVFTSPEVASVGINTDTAKERKLDVKVSRIPFSGLGKALAMGEERGFVQLIADRKTDIVLGAQIMGAHASDLIHEVALAMKLGATASQIEQTVHAHPSLSEAVMQAARALGENP